MASTRRMTPTLVELCNRQNFMQINICRAAPMPAAYAIVNAIFLPLRPMRRFKHLTKDIAILSLSAVSYGSGQRNGSDGIQRHRHNGHRSERA